LIEIEDANYKNRKELLVKHIHHGVDLDLQFAEATLRNLFMIWKRPVNLRTSYEEKEVTFHFDGKSLKPQS
jgi:stage V sporulation protein R